MNKWIIPLAVLAVLPAVGAAIPATGPVDEQLVEGHTVFTVIEAVANVTLNKTEYAAAVAVLVREANAVNIVEKFPGVLWFNDQYLVDPVDNNYNQANVRYPCTGAVLAVNDGDPSPVLAFDPVANGGVFPTYVESYLITDPNDHQWNVDKWDATGGLGAFNIWTVAILDFQAGYDQPDNYADSCSPFAEGDTQTPVPCGPPTGGSEGSVGLMPLRCDNEDYITDGAPAGGHTPGVKDATLKYNAVLYFFLADLTVTDGSIKNHHSGAPLPGDDISGCHDTDPAFPDQWPCPGTPSDDDAEGNSHPYNPFYVTGNNLCAWCIGRDNHGGSGGAQYMHATRQIDLYYGTAQAPAARQYRVVDTEGSTAPFFCEDDFVLCIPNDI